MPRYPDIDNNPDLIAAGSSIAASQFTKAQERQRISDEVLLCKYHAAPQHRSLANLLPGQ